MITLPALRQKHRNIFFQEGPGVWGISTEPKFGIGQRALLLQVGTGNILWDCVSLIDPDTVAIVQALGGLSAIAISHPPYYSSMVEWSRTFGNVPIFLHADDAQWVQRPDPTIQFWTGATHSIGDGLTLIRVGGHFPGFQVLHWASAEDGADALFSGDMPQVCPDRRYVSFMYSYPNYIPLSAPSVRQIVKTLSRYEFRELYGAWPGFKVQGDAKQALRISAERYLRALGDDESLKDQRSVISPNRHGSDVFVPFQLKLARAWARTGKSHLISLDRRGGLAHSHLYAAQIHILVIIEAPLACFFVDYELPMVRIGYENPQSIIALRHGKTAKIQIGIRMKGSRRVGSRPPDRIGGVSRYQTARPEDLPAADRRRRVHDG